jgi:hypothetical protein
MVINLPPCHMESGVFQKLKKKLNVCLYVKSVFVTSKLPPVY